MKKHLETCINVRALLTASSSAHRLSCQKRMNKKIHLKTGTSFSNSSKYQILITSKARKKKYKNK